MSKQWQQLAQIAKLMFDKEAAELSRLTLALEETSAKQAGLSQRNTQALEQLSGAYSALRLNGDVHWQSWVGSAQQALNEQSARLTAQKEMTLPTVQYAFGRKTALEKIAYAQTRDSTSS